VEWFKLSKPRASAGPPAQADVTAPEPARMSALTRAPMPPPIPAKSPKITFDVVAEEPRIVRPAPTKKVGFTISSSKDGETAEVQLTSPTLTVAKARMLSKSGWRVQITNAAGRQFAPSEFDEILKFD
jgi:hypothetical protein